MLLFNDLKVSLNIGGEPITFFRQSLKLIVNTVVIAWVLKACFAA